MKLTLPLIAFSLIAVVVVYSSFGGGGVVSKIPMERRPGGAADDRQLVAPRLTGTDGKGQPFTVTAKTATQAPGKSQKMNFETVVGDITMHDKGWLAIKAARGLMDGEAKTLDLYDTIDIFTDKGYECHTNTARYDFGAGVLQGAHPINCQGPLGIITAKSFEGLKETGHMTFLGGVTTTIFPAPRDADAAREAADPNSAGNPAAIDPAAVTAPTPAAPAPGHAATAPPTPAAPVPTSSSAATPPAPAPAPAPDTPSAPAPATSSAPPSVPLPRQKPTLP
jgi:lipopolysaccharide export system protein LptC